MCALGSPRGDMEVGASGRVLFSEDGARLAVCALDGEVKIWNSATGTLANRFTPEGARGAAVAAAAWSRVSSRELGLAYTPTSL